MSNVLEKDIEKKLRIMVERHGGKCLKFVSPGNGGVPDRIILLPGARVIFAETKRPKGGRLSQLQKLWRKWLRALGFRPWTIWDQEDLDAFRETELRPEPPAEVEPEKYGRWVASEWGWPDRSVHCSECGFTRDDGRGPKWKRCPICEIKMKTED